MFYNKKTLLAQIKNMEKTVLKNNKILKSALFLTVAGIITKIIGVLYKVPLLEIVGSEGLGYYQLIFPIFVFVLILSTGGVTTTLSKLIAKCKSYSEKKHYLIICILESILISVFISVLLVVFAKKISFFQGEGGLSSSYLILCPAIISCAITASLRGYFQGNGNMKFTAWSQIIEQVGKISLGLFFSYAFIKTSILKSVFGVFLGLTLAEIVCALFLIVLYFYSEKQQPKIHEQFDLKESFKLFNKELLPITLTSLISPLFSAIQSLLIVDLLFKAGIDSTLAIILFGLSGVIISLVSLPNIISSALSTTMFPLLCSIDKTDKQKNELIKFGFKIIFCMSIPCFLVFLIFSKPIVSLLYSEGLGYGKVNQLELASKIIKIVSATSIYGSLLNFTTTILQSQNKSYKACQNLLFGSIIGLMFFVLLIKNPRVNILGDSLSGLVALIVTSTLNIKEICKTATIKLNINKVLFYPLISSFVMLLLMEIFYKGLSGVVPSKIVILLTIMIGFIVYILLVFALKVFSLNDINIIKTNSKLKKTETN